MIGTEDQLNTAQRLIQPQEVDELPTHDEMFILESFSIEPDSSYANRSIREIGLGEAFGGLIVGIERGGTRILNPESSVVLKQGDLIWVFGHKSKIRELEQA
jgi:CPA2 family monovalent cation:H+ antiporter-2